MNPGLIRVRRELEDCGLSTYIVDGVSDEIVAFNYRVRAGRHRGKDVDIGLSMQETHYPEYPPHWIHVTPVIEDRQGLPGRLFTDADGRNWVSFSRPPSDFWDNIPTKHMSVYLRDHLGRFWRRA